MAENLSCVLHAPNDMRLEQRPIPQPNPGQLLIRVHTVGICGSDVHYWRHGSIGQFILKAPMVLGHETSGVVEAIGSAVTSFKKGDRVAIEPGIPCRLCHHCKTGSYNLCHEMRFFATPPYDGSLARFIVHDSDFCFKIPENVSFEEAALVEPLCVAVHACRRAGVSIGQRVLVCGAGPIGILCMLVAKSHGASHVLVTDINDGRLQLAKKLGAEHTLNVGSLSAEDAREAIRAELGKAPDVSMECTGAENSVATAMLTTRSGGVMVLIGNPSGKVSLPIVDAASREVDIRGIFRYANCYPTAIELISSGRIDLSGLTRAHYTLEQSEEAFNRCLKADVTKVFIGCEKKE